MYSAHGDDETNWPAVLTNSRTLLKTETQTKTKQKQKQKREKQAEKKQANKQTNNHDSTLTNIGHSSY